MAAVLWNYVIIHDVTYVNETALYNAVVLQDGGRLRSFTEFACSCYHVHVDTRQVYYKWCAGNSKVDIASW